jgi:hypothetical protein
MHVDFAGVDRLFRVIVGWAFRAMNGFAASFAGKVYHHPLVQVSRVDGLAVW